VDLRTLVRTLLKAVERIAPHAVPVDMEGPPVAASPRQALPLSMILLEWFTNSGKYGAHSLPSGRVRVSWERVIGNGDGKGERVRLRWRESGGPPIRDREPLASLGTELVKGFTTLELRGRYEAKYPLEGADYLLEFPVHDRDEPLGIGGSGTGEGRTPEVFGPITEQLGEPLTDLPLAEVSSTGLSPTELSPTELSPTGLSPTELSPTELSSPELASVSEPLTERDPPPARVRSRPTRRRR
jgi:hypothetical protein